MIGVIGVIGARRPRPGVGEDGNGSGMDERGVGVGVVKWVEWSGVEDSTDGESLNQSIIIDSLSSPLLSSPSFLPVFSLHFASAVGGKSVSVSVSMSMSVWVWVRARVWWCRLLGEPAPR